MSQLVIPPLRLFLQRWGAHPDHHKAPADGLPIEEAGVPPRLILPLSQHVGAAARPIVKVGERVLRGQVIARAAANISAPVHASSSGTVIAIGEAVVPHASGLSAEAITILTDGLDERVPSTPERNPQLLEPAEIARRVAEAGVVGMGGATFPSAVKLALGKKSGVDTLILNGSECEPYLSCDDRVMREHAEDVVEGARLIQRAIGATRILIGIEDNKPQAIAAMKRAAHLFRDILVARIPSRYPMGADRQLIHTLTGIEAPADGRAADVGVVVHNVGTALAVQRALRWGEALTERVVTVSGGAVIAPRNLRVRIGTPVAYLFERCGGLTGTPARMVVGGPMMGIAIHSGDTPVVKGASGVLALTATEVGEREPSACIRCASCVSACPAGLMPLEMMGRIRAGDVDAASAIGLDDCLTCGACAFVCPSRIPLVQFFMHAKGDVTVRAKEKKRLDQVRQLSEAHVARIEEEARLRAEKHARMKAERERAQAAAQAEQTEVQP
ncbi:MAG: electron transport complex subunit RsxC [Rhodocyclaceae bacterium]